MIAEIRELDIDKIHPNHRLVFDEDIILCLGEDIRCRGLQEAIVVELVECRFEIVDGEKRWRACKKIGLSKVKAKILFE
jgi:ParB family chromosome partitioning protein